MADFGQTTPLYHAAVLRWPEMSQFLMEHGAGPQNDSFYTNNRRTGGKSSVLSRLIATTANMRDEVQDFLTMACRLGHKDLVKPQDILAIFVLNRHPTDAMQWSDTGLTWHNRANEHISAGLWQAIVRADQKQTLPLRHQVQQSKLIIQAARCRDLHGVSGLLDLGFDPNGYIERPRPWRLQTTALDMVAWTADVDDSEFCDGNLDLKHTDADIAKLLLACGEKRG